MTSELNGFLSGTEQEHSLASLDQVNPEMLETRCCDLLPEPEVQEQPEQMEEQEDNSNALQQETT